MGTGPRAAGDVAVLGGTVHEPCFELRFGRDDTHLTTGQALTQWVKERPDRRWDPDNRYGKCWVVSGFGSRPGQDLAAAGFGDYVVDIEAPEGTDLSLAALTRPKAVLSDRAGYATVFPRLLGYLLSRTLLGGTARWIPGGARRFEVPLSSFPIEGVDTDPAVLIAAAEHTARRVELDEHAGDVALSIGLEAAGQAGVELANLVGSVPDWFGLELDDYQLAGALAVAAGHALLADEPGLGKTRQFLAAAAMLRSKRTVIMCPPVVVTAWERETLASGLADDHHGLLEPYLAALAAEEQGAEPAGPGGAPPTSPRPAGSDAPTSLVDRGPHGATAKKKPSKKRKPKGPVPGTPGWNIVTFRSGRKEPDLPPYGVVIVPDTLVAGRPELAKRLAAWAPDVVGSDEAHRAKTWMSTRSKAIRDLAAAARIQGVAITGTPLFAKCLELAGPLAVAGLLDPVFGGYYKYREDFCRKDNFNQWVTRKSKLPELKRLLDKHCWVLRFKTDVLKDLPPKRRQASLIDVDLAGFRSAHDDVVEEIDEWLRTFIADEGRDPEFKEMKAWAKSQVSMMTRLRVAAGLAKIPTIVEKIGQWIETHPETDGVYDRPLIVWAHHGDVAEALVAAVTDKGQKASSILGSTSHNTRSRVVDEYQAGTVPVLVASIHAAGVGITLTRGCDAWFAEADPTPAIISQAECRQDRRGQTRPVTCTTFIAPGTFDERIQAILNTKSEELDVLMPGADDNVAVLDTKEIREPWEIIVELTQARLARQFTRKKRQAA